MALAAIHRAGVVHRDFKPGNVLLGPDGPRVIDFGVSRALDSTATLTAGAVGTPSYMAPEQLGTGTVGPAADVFAWACTMLYAATGSPPFGNDSVAAVMTRVLNAEPDLSGVPAPLAGVVAACLAKDPAARPGIREVLDRVLGEPADGAATSTPAVSPSPSGTATSPAVPPATAVDTTPALPPIADTTPTLPPATAVDTGPAVAPPSAAGADPSAPTITSMPFPAPPPPGVVPTVQPDGAPGSGGRRRRWPALAGAVAVLAVLAGAGVWWLGGGGAQQKYTSLTDSGCRMVPAATVRKLVPEATVDEEGAGPEDKATYFRAGCAWERIGDSSPILRELTVEVSVELDMDDDDLLDGDPTDGVRRAKAGLTSTRKDFASKANRTQDLGGGYVTYYGPTAELSGIGDEAVVLSRHELARDGADYDPEVVEIDARLANARIMVKYSSGANTGKRMLPTSEPVVRKEAETVARSLLDSLKNCAGCTR
jgi:hypothetical protein